MHFWYTIAIFIINNTTNKKKNLKKKDKKLKIKKKIHHYQSAFTPLIYFWSFLRIVGFMRLVDKSYDPFTNLTDLHA